MISKERLTKVEHEVEPNYGNEGVRISNKSKQNHHFNEFKNKGWENCYDFCLREKGNQNWADREKIRYIQGYKYGSLVTLVLE